VKRSSSKKGRLEAALARGQVEEEIEKNILAATADSTY
jgi:hypothetical protein